MNEHRLFQLGLTEAMEVVRLWSGLNEIDLIFHIMFYSKLYILTSLTILECAINANGHLFVRLSFSLVSHT